MKNTGPIYKPMISLVNVALTFILAFPFLTHYEFSREWEWAWIGTFFLYNLVCEVLFEKCLGMKLFNAVYEIQSPLWRKILYVILYTASFSTLFFYIWFPFDILLINIFVVQLPCVLFTGTTLHGFLSGNIKTVFSR